MDQRILELETNPIPTRSAGVIAPHVEFKEISKGRRLVPPSTPQSPILNSPATGPRDYLSGCKTLKILLPHVLGLATPGHTILPMLWNTSR